MNVYNVSKRLRSIEGNKINVRIRGEREREKGRRKGIKMNAGERQKRCFAKFETNVFV